MKTERIGSELQDTLVELADLASQAKQLHWNVTGRQFRSLHEHLDELTAEVRSAADAVAERAVAIGYAPYGRVGTVAVRSSGGTVDPSRRSSDGGAPGGTAGGAPPAVRNAARAVSV